MRTKIRELRKRHKLTLQDLARKIGTTPQTVQRLETANMTVSTDWLEKFARAFGVQPADLLQNSGHREIPILGTLTADANLKEPRSGDDRILNLDIPARHPIAVRLGDQIGPHIPGAILIADKSDHTELPPEFHGKDYLIALRDGRILVRKSVQSNSGTLILIPYDPNLEIEYIKEVDWIARVVMTICYF